MKVKMTNQSDHAIFIPEGMELAAGETQETEVEVPKSTFWYLDESFKITVQKLQAWTRVLREVTYSWMRIGPKLMAVRI